MEGLEKLLEEAEQDYDGSFIYKRVALSRYPFALPAAIAAVGELVEATVVGSPDQDIFWKDLHPWSPAYIAAAATYLGLSGINEYRVRKEIGGEPPRKSTLVLPLIESSATMLTTTLGLADYYAGSPGEYYGAGLIAASASTLLARAARGAYLDAEEHGPLETDPRWRHIAHDVLFAYPEAVAIAVGAVGAFFLPLEQMLSFTERGNVPKDDAGVWLPLLKANLSTIGMYYGRAMAGTALNWSMRSYHNARTWLSGRGDSIDDALEHHEKRAALSVSGIEAIRTKRKSARLYLKKNNLVEAIRSFDDASRISSFPFTKPQGSPEKDRFSKHLPRRIEELNCGDPKQVSAGMRTELEAQRFSYAALYAKKQIELEPTNIEHVASLSMLLHIQRDYEGAAKTLEEYVRLIVPQFAQAQQAETLGESRHSVWYVPGPIPGYLRRMESEQRAWQEYYNALFFYKEFGNRVPTPIEPVIVGDEVFIFSPAYGEGTLLDKERKGKARHRDIFETAKLYIDINEAALKGIADGRIVVKHDRDETLHRGERIIIDDPLTTDSEYLEKRLMSAFISPLREHGIEISQTDETALRGVVEALRPYVLALPRGIYRDLNPKNVVEGPAGLKAPIDWEEMILYPLQKDFLKLFKFGADHLPPKLYDDVLRQVIDDSYKLVGKNQAIGDYARQFREGLSTLGALVHMDMTGYALKDEITAGPDKTKEWYHMAQGYHMQESIKLLHECEVIVRTADEQARLSAGIAALEKISASAYAPYQSVTPMIPDMRRGNLRTLLERIL